MKLVKFLLISMILANSLPAYCWLSQYVGVKGIIRGYDKKEVEIEDTLRARVFIPRDAIDINFKLVSGKVVSIPVDVQKFSQIRSSPNSSARKLHNQSELAFANLQKEFADLKK